jgi:DNA-binding winged helix-turn-helix (wHTH) protein
MPDSLASVVERNMKRNQDPFSFSISVAIAGKKSLVYGFTSEDLKNGKVPCIGRIMPKDNYTISLLAFREDRKEASAVALPILYPVAGAAISCLLVIGSGLVYYRRNKKNVEPFKAPDTNAEKESRAIGEYRFFPSKQLLSYKDVRFTLTAKEQTLLTIFLKTPNTVIDRNTLLKEGWEDQGVITRRSLDMYVSRLRKKLQLDEAISITNEHGKGYSFNYNATSLP